MFKEIVKWSGLGILGVVIYITTMIFFNLLWIIPVFFLVNVIWLDIVAWWWPIIWWIIDIVITGLFVTFGMLFGE